jgi:hypothetical protein
MNLYEKIISLYPSLTNADFVGNGATIYLRNDSDGKGDYIKNWSHPTLKEPTQAELDAI